MTAVKRKVQLIDPSPRRSAAANEAIKERLRAIRGEIRQLAWEQARWLWEIRNNNLWKHWGFKDFTSYLASETGVSLRSCQYMISTWSWFNSLSPEVEEWGARIGWSKAKELVEIVDSKNWSWWRAKLGEDGNNLTLRQLIDLVREQKER
jgi:hypothetical protein